MINKPLCRFRMDKHEHLLLILNFCPQWPKLTFNLILLVTVRHVQVLFMTKAGFRIYMQGLNAVCSATEAKL